MIPGARWCKSMMIQCVGSEFYGPQSLLHTTQVGSNFQSVHSILSFHAVGSTEAWTVIFIFAFQSWIGDPSWIIAVLLIKVGEL